MSKQIEQPSRLEWHDAFEVIISQSTGQPVTVQFLSAATASELIAHNDPLAYITYLDKDDVVVVCLRSVGDDHIGREHIIEHPDASSLTRRQRARHDASKSKTRTALAHSSRCQTSTPTPQPPNHARAQRRRTPGDGRHRLRFASARHGPAGSRLTSTVICCSKTGTFTSDHQGVGRRRPPRPRRSLYVQMLRDARLLAGLWPPLRADGRATMALDDDRDPEHGRQARPGPYLPPDDRRARADPADLELARRAAISLQEAKRVDADARAPARGPTRQTRPPEHD
jgi:hypothetical protein